MNKQTLHKLHQYAQNRILTDVQIELTDDHVTNPVRLNLHKIILCVHSEYFRAMFLNDKFQDCHLVQISIHVPHVAVCCDIINSFYGVETNYQKLSQTEHILWTFICNDFFMIPNFVDCLVPIIDILPVHFDLLLTVVHILGCDDTIAQIVFNNIPDDYDVTKLSVELRSSLLKLASTPVCMGTDDIDFCFVGCSHRKNNITTTICSFQIHFLSATKTTNHVSSIRTYLSRKINVWCIS